MTDVLRATQEELQDAMAPVPEDYMQDFSPPAALVYARLVAMQALTICMAATASLKLDETEEQPTLTEVLNGCMAAVAGFTHALVSLEVLPKEAGEAKTDA